MPLAASRIRWRRFRGGADLPAEEYRGTVEPIRDLPWPTRLTVPLLQHPGVAATPIVKVGQSVRAGQLIGQADRPDALNVHAPAAGTVTAMTRAATAHHPDVSAIELATADEAASGAGPRDSAGPLPTLTVDQLAEMADGAGILNLARPARPLGDQIRRASGGGVSDLIINSLPTEPLLVGGRESLRGHVEAVVQAGLYLRDAMSGPRVWLVVDRREGDLVRRCRSAVRGTAMRVVAVRNRVPQADPVLLVWALTGRETPIGGCPEDVGGLVVEVESVLALAEAVRESRPMTHRVVNVTGPAVARPGLYRVPVGTAVRDLLERVGLSRSPARIVDGGPMTGRALETPQAVVTKRTSAILVLDHEHASVPAPGPCIRCGWCQEVCPVGLDPPALLDAAERSDAAVAARLHPGACLSCGLCSLVCPAELPLALAAAQLERHAGPGGAR